MFPVVSEAASEELLSHTLQLRALLNPASQKQTNKQKKSCSQVPLAFITNRQMRRRGNIAIMNFYIPMEIEYLTASPSVQAAVFQYHQLCYRSEFKSTREPQ